MTLRGAVHAFPLETVLQLLADTGKTGQLEIRSEDERAGLLGMTKGRLVSAQFEDETGPVALGAIFTFQRGYFEFTPQERIGERVGTDDLTGELEDLLDRAAAERDRQIAIRALVPNERLRFRLSERAAERAEIKLSSEQWRVLLAVDGQRDVQALSDHLQLRRLATLDVLAGLVRAGMIEPVEPGEGEPVGRSYRRLRPMQPIPPTVAGEPIVLRGAVEHFPTETILQLLALTKKTGRLEIRDGGEGSTLGVADGRLVSASWAEESGELALGAAFTAAGGEFDFIPMADAPSANLVGDLDDLLDRATETRDRIVTIRTLVPNERVRFKLSDRATQHTEITLTSDEWRALLAVNGERDVLGIADHLHMRRLPTMVILADLIQNGLVDVLPPPEPPPSWPDVDRRRAAAAAAVAPLPPVAPVAWQPAAEEPAAEEVPVEEVTEAPPIEAEPARAAGADLELADAEAAEVAPSEAAFAEVPPAEIAPEVEEPLAETPLDREPAADDRLSAITSVVGPAEPAPPPTSWEPPPITEVPPPPAWEPAAPTTWEPAAPTWEPAREETAEPEAAVEPAPAERYVDPRLAAFGLESAPPAAEPEAAEPALDPRLAAFGIPPAQPAAPPSWEPSAPAAWDRTEAPAWEPTAPAQPPETWPPAEAPLEERPATEIRPLEEEPVAMERAVTAQPAMGAAVEAPVVVPEKKKGLFGGLFGGGRAAAPAAAAPTAAPPPTIAGAGTRAGALALFVNELLAAYNSGQYGKGRVEDRMLSLLMRADEQADPIDRPMPVLNDRLDVGEIDESAVPERQALPYLATVARQIYDDAERALGRGQAKRGFRDVRARLFGKDVSLFQAPEVAGRVPKV